MLTPELREQIDEQDYLTIENALQPFGLDRVRAAFEAIQRQTEPAWAESIRNGTFKGGYGNGPDAHTMGDIHQYDTFFLDIAENPLVLPILKGIEAGRTDDGDGRPLPSRRNKCSYRLASRPAGLAAFAIHAQGEGFLFPQ